jgi:hypothetical protein
LNHTGERVLVSPSETLKADVFVELRPVQTEGGRLPSGALFISGALQARVKAQRLAAHNARAGFDEDAGIGEPELFDGGHDCGGWLKKSRQCSNQQRIPNKVKTVGMRKVLPERWMVSRESMGKFSRGTVIYSSILASRGELS